MVAILMATYNGEEYLIEQIESIINQSFKNWKLIIRDDGSTDKTPIIIEKYRKKFPEKIEVLDGKNNLGVAQNFLKLLKSVDDSYEYIFFCDQDDVWLKDKIIETLNKFKKTNNPQLVFTDLIVVDKKLKKINDSFIKLKKINPTIKKIGSILSESKVTGCTMAINKELKNIINTYTFSKVVMHDSLISTIAFLVGEINYLNKGTIYYRQHSKNQIGAKKDSFKKFYLYIIDGKISKNLFLSQLQVEEILNNLGDILKKEQKDVLKAFINLYKYSFFRDKLKMIRYNFFKSTFLKTFIYIALTKRGEKNG